MPSGSRLPRSKFPGRFRRGAAPLRDGLYIPVHDRSFIDAVCSYGFRPNPIEATI
jgi:hypothetical protein